MVHLTYEEEKKGEGVGDGGRKREQEKDEIFYFHWLGRYKQKEEMSAILVLINSLWELAAKMAEEVTVERKKERQPRFT